MIEKCYHCEDSDSGLLAYDAPDGSEAYICRACHDVEKQDAYERACLYRVAPFDGD
jgi:hypothetical protein